MRLICMFCVKSVSNEVPDDTVVRALCICPECMEQMPPDVFDRTKWDSIKLALHGLFDDVTDPQAVAESLRQEENDGPAA